MAVAITALLRVPPVTWYRTVVVPGEANASSTAEPDTVALLEGTTTAVAGGVTVMVAGRDAGRPGT